jgi:ubiquinone/menaquinone biosynthesis C-methylase UbiE
MRSAVTEMARVLKPGGHAVLVSGTNKMRGSVFDTPSYLETIMLQCGFITTLRLVDGIRSRGLMTKRNRTADVIWHEWVTVATKL